MSQDLVLIEERGAVVRLTLNRPQRHNALVPELLDALLAAVETRIDEATRAVILQAHGRSFSTGGDVAALWLHRDDIAAYADRLVGGLNRVILALARCPAPVVCAVQGMVCGGALGLVLAADLVLLAPAASFTPYYGVVGFAPDGGWTAMLPERIGRTRTAELLLTNATLGPDEAVRIGLANRVTGDPNALADEMAATMAGLEHGSLRAARRLLAGNTAALAARLDAERHLFVAQIQTDEARIGMQRFLESR